MSRKLVLSRYVSFLPLQANLFLCGHAFHGPRCVIEGNVVELLKSFATPCQVERFVAELAPGDAGAHRAYVAFFERLRRQGVLVDWDAQPEEEALRSEFGAHVESANAAERRIKQRAPIDPRLRGRLRPQRVMGAIHASFKALYLGCCLVLPSMDVLVELAAEQGFEVKAVGSVPSDLELIDEERPDFIVLGDVRRIGLGWKDTRPLQYVEELRLLLQRIRARTDCAILLRNLPGPTCAPLGLADRGRDSLANKIRRINIEIAALAEEFADTHVVDIDQALSLRGRSGLVDDTVVLSHHLGSLTWLAERAQRDDSPFRKLMPPPELLLNVDTPRERLEAEHILASEDLRVMLSIKGLLRRKCVVVDLDNTLWPGVLAETGQPFFPDLAVDVYPHHIYLGLHEALLALRERGILLACVSKNDEEVVRRLWKYPAAFDGLPKLVCSDFVTCRINWKEKVDNLLEIAEELNLGIDSFAFIDDSPYERAKVEKLLPQVMVLGENIYAVRSQLLTHVAFQVPQVTDESRQRSELVRGNLERQRAMASAVDSAAFAASLELRCTVRRETDAQNLLRIAELVLRTNQFNTTSERLSKSELREHIDDASCAVYSLSVVDKFAHHGLVGACVAAGATLRLFVLSCRVIGLDLENILLRAVVRDLFERTGAAELIGLLVRSERNQPARRLFLDNGFSLDPLDETHFRLAASAVPGTTGWSSAYSITFEGFSKAISDSFRT